MAAFPVMQEKQTGLLMTRPRTMMVAEQGHYDLRYSLGETTLSFQPLMSYYEARPPGMRTFLQTFPFYGIVSGSVPPKFISSHNL